MTSLQLFNENGLELVINLQTGEAFATQAGYARMSGISKTALANRLARGYKGVHKNDLKLAEVLTPGGLQGVHLIPADIVFEWLMKDNFELGLAMGKVGATVYMHQQAGYKVTSTATTDTLEPKQKHLNLAKESLEVINATDRLLKDARENNNVRLIALFEATIAQYYDVYILPQSEKQPLINGQPVATTGAIQYEGVVDVVIRLGLKFDNRFESSLGSYVGKRIGHLRVSTNNETLKDYRASQAANKMIPSYMYPAYNAEVEQAVRDYCLDMDSKQWMTQAEIKEAKKAAKLAAMNN